MDDEQMPGLELWVQTSVSSFADAQSAVAQAVQQVLADGAVSLVATGPLGEPEDGGGVGVRVLLSCDDPDQVPDSLGERLYASGVVTDWHYA